MSFPGEEGLLKFELPGKMIDALDQNDFDKLASLLGESFEHDDRMDYIGILHHLSTIPEDSMYKKMSEKHLHLIQMRLLNVPECWQSYSWHSSDSSHLRNERDLSRLEVMDSFSLVSRLVRDYRDYEGFIFHSDDIMSVEEFEWESMNYEFRQTYMTDKVFVNFLKPLHEKDVAAGINKNTLSQVFFEILEIYKVVRRRPKLLNRSLYASLTRLYEHMQQVYCGDDFEIILYYFMSSSCRLDTQFYLKALLEGAKKCLSEESFQQLILDAVKHETRRYFPEPPQNLCPSESLLKRISAEKLRLLINFGFDPMYKTYTGYYIMDLIIPFHNLSCLPLLAREDAPFSTPPKEHRQLTSLDIKFIDIYFSD